MALKDILIHVDDSPSSPLRLKAAIKLTYACGAKLTGVYVLSKPYMPSYIGVQINPEILEAQAEKMKRNSEEAEVAFFDAIGSSGVKAEWRVVEDIAAEGLAIQSRYFDLAIVGQANPAEDRFIDGREMPDRLILTSGRPVLIIPYAGTFDTIGKNVLVAWDASQQASRAVHDALPLLKAADKVTVMVVNPKGGPEGTGDLPGADISKHLSSHGVIAEADHVSSDTNPGNMLLSRVADKGIDLVVMGAYGHARWAELVLGGVTKYILEHMTVPVLMAH